MGTLFRRGRSTAKQSNWIAEYTDHNGRRVQKSTKTTDKKTAAQILAHWQTESAKRISGLVNPTDERITAQSRRKLDDHRDEWLASLRAAGRSANHVNATKRYFDAIALGANWESIGDITPESLAKFVDCLLQSKRSNQTAAHYVQAAKQFTRWMVRGQRLKSNPLESINKPRPSLTRVLERRMLLPAEWPWLRDASGPRAIVYELAIQTGLRSGEVRTLKRSSFDLDSAHPHVIVRSGSTKDGNRARQYITIDLAAKIKSHPPASAAVMFLLPTKYEMAEMVRDDLAAARQIWLERNGNLAKSDQECDFLMAENHCGETLDFHALRHTCGAWLAIQGVHPKTIQTVMRHKSITLTMDTYGHLFPGAEPEAIDKIGRLLASENASGSGAHR